MDYFTVGNYLPLIAGSCQFVKVRLHQTTGDYRRLHGGVAGTGNASLLNLCLYDGSLELVQTQKKHTL